jgi:membrane protein
VWSLLKASFSDWSRHQVPKLGAALAYYTVLSLAPLVIVVVAVVGLVFGQQAARGEILQQIQSLVGYQGAQAIQTVVAQAYKPKSGIIATALGLITLFISASGVLVELRDSLNKIWDVPPQPDTGVWTTVKERFLSFGMLLAIGFLLLVSLILSAAITAAGTFVSGLLPVPEWVLQAANALLSLVVFTALFAMLYRFMPDVTITWHDTFLGAAFTSVLFTIGKFLIGLYLGKASVASAYGAAGSLVVLLVWVYYSAQVFFFGAEFTHVFALRRGSHSPSVHAGTSVVTVPVSITGPVESEQAAGGGSQLNPHRTIALGLAAMLGGLSWWRGKTGRRAGTESR